ncbi:MAG: citramalate synthase [Alphaproteobacteria bacterium]|nr:citramalate synthase [Alphaproteobacteria bacterium]
MAERIYLYDSTLRVGAQARGVDFQVADKIAIAGVLDKLGLDYIEGGFPGANPVDDAFFRAAPKFSRAKLSAFGMTRRAGRSADNDPGLTDLLSTTAGAICLVGKAWDAQVEKALEVSLDENLAMITDSLTRVAKANREAIFDAEHCFDGYKANPDYTLKVLQAAFAAGARWIVLCDTNGGTLPHEIEEIVGAITKHIPGEKLGIHCHDDTGNAVANSLAAVRAGVRQVQGTINGVGERCGNANLVSLIPTLVLKMGFETSLAKADLPKLAQASRFLDDKLNRASNPHAPYVGSAAFAHKGGLHASAVAKDSSFYEHVDPASVGNQRQVLISDKAGKTNVLTRLADLGMAIPSDHPRLAELVALVKERESQGYAYEGADASFALLAKRLLDYVPEYFKVISYRVIDESRFDAKGAQHSLSEASIKVDLSGDIIMTVAEGNGPVNALDRALRKSLSRDYPQLKDVRLVDYKVRILNSGDGTRAVTRVMIESMDGEGRSWNTVGVSANILDASFLALHDSLVTCLLESEAGRKAA